MFENSLTGWNSSFQTETRVFIFKWKLSGFWASLLSRFQKHKTLSKYSVKSKLKFSLNFEKTLKRNGIVQVEFRISETLCMTKTRVSKPRLEFCLFQKTTCSLFEDQNSSFQIETRVCLVVKTWVLSVSSKTRVSTWKFEFCHF